MGGRVSPRRAPSTCAQPGCPELTTTTRCPKHEAEYQRLRNARRTHYKREWRKLSQQARRAQPWCSACGATADLTADHVRARSLDEGVEVLCRSCNTKKGGGQ